MPGALGPLLAAAWKDSEPDEARPLSPSDDRILGPAVAASIGLILTAKGWMPVLFGSTYSVGSTALGVIAARLPLVLLAATVAAAARSR